MTAAISEFVSKTLNVSPSDFTILKLFGQASARQYFRITHNSGNTNVIMLMPEGFASKAEEVTKIDPDFQLTEPAFLNVQRYLHALDIRVPEVLATNPEQGLILLQDLGDQTLEACILNASSEFKVFYYRKAIDTLIDLWTKTQAHPDAKCVCEHRRFTVDLLKWEVDHFCEYGIEDRFGIKIPPDMRKRADDLSQKLCERVAQMPQGFVHRDFQSRNLMMFGYDFWLIDFQDALQGPAIYDLVALLRDSYVSFTPAETELLLDDYLSKLPAHHPYAGNPKQLHNDFHTLTLQRKLKDTGRFQFIATVKKNPGFLPHVPQSLIYVKQAFEQNPEWNTLRNIFAEYVAELK